MTTGDLISADDRRLRVLDRGIVLARARFQLDEGECPRSLTELPVCVHLRVRLSDGVGRADRLTRAAASTQGVPPQFRATSTHVHTERAWKNAKAAVRERSRKIHSEVWVCE